MNSSISRDGIEQAKVDRQKIVSKSKLLSFDVFGTLLDVREGSRSAFDAIIQEADGSERIDAYELWDFWEHTNIKRYWETPYQSYRAICRLSLQDAFRHFGLRGDPDLVQLYFDAFSGFRRFPDVDLVLDQLGARYKLAVVSNIDDSLLEMTSLGRNFDLVCTAERARGYKPNGTLFRYLVASSGLDIDEILHSGQSQHTDLVGGKSLGLTIAWINRRSLRRAQGVPAPDFEFTNLVPLVELLTSEATQDKL